MRAGTLSTTPLGAAIGRRSETPEWGAGGQVSRRELGVPLLRSPYGSAGASANCDNRVLGLMPTASKASTNFDAPFAMGH
jgi:hypothetical protein